MLSQNEHTLVQMNSAEFIELVISRKQKQGLTKEQAINEAGEVIASASASGKQYWDKNRDGIKTVSGLIPVLADGVALRALAIEMQRGGNILSSYKVVTYSGKANIIFQGYAGLRKDLTGTRYLASNPKVISMGIGKLGALKSITKGGVVTILISAGFHALDQMMKDEKTWHDLVGGMAVDMAIVAGSTAIAWGLVMTAAAVTTFVVGSLAVIFVVGMVIGGFSIMFIDSSYWSDKMANALGIIEKDLKKDLSQAKLEIEKANDLYKTNPLFFMHKLFGIPYRGLSY